ncbi:MAG: ThuA domain-containing protein [Gemmatimonadetes bacterium]|nr:ThuA domain-containing protein [Gemmatimonadota bacterium]
MRFASLPNHVARLRPAGIAVLALVLAMGGAPSPGFAQRDARQVAAHPRLLKTAGYRHASIETGAAAITNKPGAEHGFAVDLTEDAAAFTDRNLKRYRAVVFLQHHGRRPQPAGARLRALHPGRRRLRGHSQRDRHRVRLAVVRQARRRLPTGTREPGTCERGRSACAMAGTPRPGAPGAMGARGRVLLVQVDQSGDTRPGRHRRDELRRGDERRESPDELVPRPSMAGVPGTRTWDTRRRRSPSRSSCGTC